MPAHSRRSAAQRPEGGAKRPRAALQIGNRVSVLTRVWGDEYARSVHGGRYQTGRTLSTVVGEDRGRSVCDFGEGEGQHVAWAVGGQGAAASDR